MHPGPTTIGLELVLVRPPKGKGKGEGGWGTPASILSRWHPAVSISTDAAVTSLLQAGVVQYGKDFMAQFAPVQAEPKNGAMITSCICHGCNWGALTTGSDNKTSYVNSTLATLAAACICPRAALKKGRGGEGRGGETDAW